MWGCCFFFFFLAQLGSAKIRVGHPELFGRMRLNGQRSGRAFSPRVKSAIWGMASGQLDRQWTGKRGGTAPNLLVFPAVAASRAAFVAAEIHRFIRKSRGSNLDTKTTF